MSRGNPTAEVFSGILLLIAVHFIFWVGIFVLSYFVSFLLSFLKLNIYGLPPYFWLWPLLGLGLTQLLYVIPLCIYYSRQRQFNTMKGIIIGAILTALLNGGCFLMFLPMMW